MPLKKQNKHQSHVKRDIKKHLMKINIRVDKYIYQNKTITIEEAEKYMHEISFYRTQCNTDKHIYQVIEKLTKYMKYIIQEAKKNEPLKPKDLASENNPKVPSCIKSSASNIGEEKGDCNFPAAIVEKNIPISKIQYQKSTTVNDKVISSRKNENEHNEKQPVHNEYVHDLSIEGYSKYLKAYEINKEIKSSNFNTLGVTTENIHIDRMSGLLLAMTHISLTNNTNDKHTKPLTPDEVLGSNINISSKTKEIAIDKCNLANKSKKPKKYKQKPLISVENTQQTQIALICPKKRRNIKNNKKIYNNETLNPSAQCQNLNFEATNIYKSKTVKNDSLKDNVPVPKDKDPIDLSKSKIIRKNNFNKNKENVQINAKELKNITSSICTNRGTNSNEMTLPVLKENNSAVTNQHIISKHMGALKICNESVLNDLSWIENIRYVREIRDNEFELNSNTCNEMFWDNFSMPSGWNNDDFLV